MNHKGLNMSKEKVVVQIDSGDNNLSHYEIKTKYKAGDIKVNLHRGNTQEWTEQCRGEKIMQLHDDGDCITLKVEEPKQKIKLSYSQIEELEALLEYYRKRIDTQFITSFRFFKEI